MRNFPKVMELISEEEFKPRQPGVRDDVMLCNVQITDAEILSNLSIFQSTILERCALPELQKQRK